MGTFYASLSGLESFFALCAVVGGVTLVVRIVLMLIGADGADGADPDVSLTDPGEATDAGFRVISLQGITSFFMMFGLVGLALSKQNQTSPAVAVVGGVAAGVLSVWVIGRIFAAMTRLQSDGTLNMVSAVGERGVVYLTVKPRQGGKVSITLQGRLCVLDAVTEGDEPIPTGEAVEVVGISSGSVLVVSRVIDKARHAS